MSLPNAKTKRKTVRKQSSCFREAVLGGDIEYAGFTRWKHVGTRLPDEALPGLLLANYWSCTSAQNWQLHWHRNEGVELTFMESGKEMLNLPDQQIELHPDDLAITRPWHLHQIGDPTISIGRCHFLVLDVGARTTKEPWQWPEWIILSPEDKNELERRLRYDPRILWQGAAEVRHVFQDIAKIATVKPVGKSLSQLAILVNELLRLVLETLRRQKHSQADTAQGTDAQQDVSIFLQELPHRLSEPWTVDTMAHACGLGMTRFVHHCKTLTNLTPMHYLNRQRVMAAAQMLDTNKNMSITTIALDCGFASSQYFATVFRQHFGRSPRNYRNRPIISEDM